MGHNVSMHKKGPYYNLNPSTTKRNNVFIVIATNEVSHIDNLVFFTERDEMIPRSSFDKKNMDLLCWQLYLFTKNGIPKISS